MLTCAMQIELWLYQEAGNEISEAKNTVLVIVMISLAHNNYGWTCILHLIIYLFNVLQYFPL